MVASKEGQVALFAETATISSTFSLYFFTFSLYMFAYMHTIPPLGVFSQI